MAAVSIYHGWQRLVGSGRLPLLIVRSSVTLIHISGFSGACARSTSHGLPRAGPFPLIRRRHVLLQPLGAEAAHGMACTLLLAFQRARDRVAKSGVLPGPDQLSRPDREWWCTNRPPQATCRPAPTGKARSSDTRGRPANRPEVDRQPGAAFTQLAGGQHGHSRRVQTAAQLGANLPIYNSPFTIYNSQSRFGKCDVS